MEEIQCLHYTQGCTMPIIYIYSTTLLVILLLYFHMTCIYYKVLYLVSTLKGLVICVRSSLTLTLHFIYTDIHAKDKVMQCLVHICLFYVHTYIL